MSEKVILLTACVNPIMMHKTALLDPSIRLQHYINSINFYLQETSFDIIVVDNTSTDLSIYFEKHPERKRLETLFFEGNKFNPLLGKGYGEVELLEYAILNSKKINFDTIIVKITGRLIFSDICRFISKLFGMVDSNAFVSADFTRTLKASNSKVFISDKRFLIKYLIPLKYKINDSMGFYFEHILGEAIQMSVLDGYNYIPFPYYNHLDGVSGTTNTVYKIGNLEYVLRSVYCNLKGKYFKWKLSK